MSGTPPGLHGSLRLQRKVLEELLRRVPQRVDATPAPDRPMPDPANGALDPAVGALDPAAPVFDPVFLVRRYADPRDQEIAGMITALLAYGRVDLICRAAGWVLERMGPSPQRFLKEGGHLEPRWGAGFRYRFNSRRDLIGLLEAIASAVRVHGTLGASLAFRRSRATDLDSALTAWIAELRDQAGRVCRLSPGLRFLLPDPGLGGACKRWRLYLRWMIRPEDGTDLGTWSGILPASELVLPLDTHWIRIGTRLGLTRRRTPDGRMAAEITEGLRRLNPSDPLRYDYAVCHLGISGQCPPRLTAECCRSCPLRRVCPTPNSAAAPGP